ncbi:flotillin family protein [Pelagicoccus sp. NFK12]|uniref:Flotillin family protein n=1 Tax=Pelagicoccus enzymogenes TaxID=2773457 RepID=A0A927F9L0_9BACT|nr:flotillin domain-containing protein [Pelagicoccus enzymogenes]MBD5781013.1 flotillin family protein [Pelagicoccus enzymogenes]MDQ8198702.1 flotillin domain-containing protein [Pelagicoccus enzymogenes]
MFDLSSLAGVVGLGVILVLTILFILSRFYRRASKEVAFVRTGMGGEKVILDGGGLKWPVFHEIILVNMRTLRLQVDRKNEEGLITADRMRVDVTAEFYLRVKPEKESIAKAAQTLGERTLEPERLKELLQGKFVDALRSVAAGLSMEQLHEQRAEFIQSVQVSLSEDLLKNGLELESVSLTALDQTGREYFKEDNAFDAQGLAKLTLITESKREERNRIEQETRIKIENQNLDAAKQSFEIKRAEEFARLDQQREVEMATAQQSARIKTEDAIRKREAEEARISAEQAVKEADILSRQAVDERDIEAKRRIEEADIQRRRSVDVSGQEAAIIVAKKSEEKSQAEAEAAKARSNFVREEEQVVTVRETAIANRKKEIELIKAREDAEKQAIDVTVAAEADKQAALDKAEAVLTESKAAAEKIRIIAEADQKRFEVEAYGEKAINEAKNILSSELIGFELRKILAQVAPKIMEASVKPMEKIDSIKILQANGFGGTTGGANGSNGTSNAGGGSLPNQLVDAALGYRMNLPLVDKMLEELGLDPKSAEGLSALLKEKGDLKIDTETEEKTVKAKSKS